MQTLGTVDEQKFSSKPADVADTRSFLESAAAVGVGLVTAPRDLFSSEERARMGAMFDAAERQTRLVETSSARRAAREDVYDRMIDEVRRTTGEDLANPLRRNTTELAGRIAKGEFQGWNDPRLNELIAGREDAFLSRLEILKREHGDRLKVDLSTGVDRQAAANARTADADQRREFARDDGNAALQLGALIGGAVYGSREDPLFWLSLPFGGPGKSASALGRVANAAISNATASAAFSAVAQPTVQAWRADVGLEAGLGEAVQNIGMAGLVGGVAGGGLQALGEGLSRVLTRVRAGDVSPAEMVKVADEAGVFLDDETRLALRGAASADEADRALLNVPQGLPGREADSAFADVARLVDDPAAPLPLGSRPIMERTDLTALSRILDEAPDTATALRGLRGDPVALAAALASDLDDVRLMGHAASLRPQAFAMVDEGKVSTLAGAIIARMSDDEARQAALLGRVAEMGASTAEAIREVASDMIRIDQARASAAAVMGDNDIKQPRRRRTERAPQSLLQFLAMRGGLADDAELSVIFDGNKFVPGYGMLVRKNGMSLDHAFEVASEAGYFFDARFDAGGLRSLNYNDMLTAIDNEHRGQRLYRMGEEPAAKLDASENKVDIERAIDRFVVDNDLGSIDEALYKRTAEIMDREGIYDPDLAFERAVMEARDANPIERAFRHAETGDLPGWDYVDDGGAASGGGRTDPGLQRPADAGGRTGAPGEGVGSTGESGRTAPSTERTDQGTQILIEGVAPVTDRQRLEVQATKPMSGGNRPPPAGGLFDEGARAQTDLLDMVPLMRDDGTAVTVARDALDQVGARERGLADLVRSCKA